MENEITWATFQARPATEQAVGESVELIKALVKDRDLWKEQALETVLFVQDRKEQIDALKRVNAEQLTRIEELVDQLEDLKAVSERTAAHALVVEEERDELQDAYKKLEGLVARQSRLINRLHEERDHAQMSAKLTGASLEGVINDLKAENQKLREAVVQAPFAPKGRELVPEYEEDPQSW